MSPHGNFPLTRSGHRCPGMDNGGMEIAGLKLLALRIRECESPDELSLLDTRRRFEFISELGFTAEERVERRHNLEGVGDV